MLITFPGMFIFTAGIAQEGSMQENIFYCQLTSQEARAMV